MAAAQLPAAEGKRLPWPAVPAPLQAEVERLLGVQPWQPAELNRVLDAMADLALRAFRRAQGEVALSWLKARITSGG